MRLLPLVPSSHPSAWLGDAGETGREDLANVVFDRDDHTCRFCGHRVVGFQDVFNVDGDHENWSLDNLATACVLCHGVQHLGGGRVTDELAVIWLPDMSQAALNSVVRRIHQVLFAHGEPPDLASPPRSESPRVYAALRAYRALAGEAKAVKKRIHTSCPREIGAALLSGSAEERAILSTALGGIRFLHRGRLFRNGRDVYPEIILASLPLEAPTAIAA